MKITLHVGPHKTGTSSVQSWLLENSATFLHQQGIYYPPVEKFPPGHALIAWKTLGLNNHQAEPTTLSNILAEAAKKGANHIVLSSEEFSRGLSEGTMRNLHVLNDFGALELLVTLTPLPDRFLAEIAEEIKHADSFDLSKVDVPDFCMRRPGLWPNFLELLRADVCPASTHVILCNKNNPKFLFDSFSQILGVSGPEMPIEHNKRFPVARTRLLNFINVEFANVPMQQRRALSEKFNAIIQAEGLADKMRPLRFPEDDTRFLAQLWKLQCDCLRGLQRSGEIQLHQVEL